MEQNHKIRNAALSDLDTIFSFISHLEETSFDPESFRESYEENIKSSSVIYLVAVNEREDVTGFISCHGQSLLHQEGMVFEIQEMYVAKNYREKGIGKALFAALEERLAKADCEILEVTMNAKRSDAKKFYLKLGFIQTHAKFVKEL